MLKTPYICPLSKTILQALDTGLVDNDGKQYPFLKNAATINPIPVFIDDSLVSGGDAVSQAMYKKVDAEFFYENFLTWLFTTFNQDEVSFRNSLIEKLNLKEGHRVLVTGCGLGDDIKGILPKIGADGELFAQDISDVMVAATTRRLNEADIGSVDRKNIYLSVSNASMLPYQDAYFDAAFHFGGINLFSDMQSAIHEMARGVKVGGKVVIGDEGIAPWLRESEYGKMAICNNKLWALEPPLSLLPEIAANVNLTWVLGNCFYVIDFEIANSKPFMDIDVPHEGIRGGSMRKRYFGQLEGIEPELKAKLTEAASAKDLSVSALLEQFISASLDKQ